MGLFTDPSLMAADILLYQAELMPGALTRSGISSLHAISRERFNAFDSPNLFTVLRDVPQKPALRSCPCKTPPKDEQIG